MLIMINGTEEVHKFKAADLYPEHHILMLVTKNYKGNDLYGTVYAISKDSDDLTPLCLELNDVENVEWHLTKGTVLMMKMNSFPEWEIDNVIKENNIKLGEYK